MQPIEIVGWTANACYFSRFLFQWIASERAGQTRVPLAFWWLSIGGAILMSIYLAVNGEVVLLVGTSINGVIAVRNLALIRSGQALSARIATPMAVALAGLLVMVGAENFHAIAGTPKLWLGISFVGEILWCSRFVLQWWSSERAGHSHLPLGFWWVSLAGNALLLTYALFRLDWILVLGFTPGPIVQVRNLVLAYRTRAGVTEPGERQAAPEPPPAGGAAPDSSPRPERSTLDSPAPAQGVGTGPTPTG